MNTPSSQTTHTQMTLQQITDEYKNYLRTPDGRKDLTTAVRMAKEWTGSDTDVSSSTNGVQINKLPKFIKEKTQKVPITGIAVNNLCHTNAKFFSKHGYKYRFGYNITACPCGCRMSFEIHSLNEKDGRLYDFTKDFNKETEKWFYPLADNWDAWKWIYFYGRSRDYLMYKKGRCTCPVIWNDNPQILQIKILQELQEIVEE